MADEFDDAVRNRLRKLDATPVDTSRLDAGIRAAIARRQSTLVWRLTRPLAAVAASITLLAILAGVLLTSSGGEVMASPAQMAQVHRDILANRVAVTKVDSIEAASAALSRQSGSAAPALPQPPEAHVMACCMKSIKNKTMACVLLQDAGGTPVTMSVARSSDMKLPHDGAHVARDGVDYFTHAADGLNMVMTERAGRIVCLISDLPTGKLIDLAARLKF